MFRKFAWFMLTILLVVPVCWQPPSALTFVGARPFSGGTASFTNGPYDWVNSTFYYNVTGAPPNVCGTLHTFRNGSQLDSPNWICTDGNGNATMGPYSGSTNQTDENVYIEWPDHSQTTGGTRHISDASPPSIGIDRYDTVFSGPATDVQWGTGFDFGPAGWSGITATFQDLTTGKYADSSGYNSSNPVNWGGGPSDYFSFSITWSVTPPPQSAHNPSHSYRWCVKIYDLFYQSNIACVGFVGVP
jgi:hypothetical protein